MSIATSILQARSGNFAYNLSVAGSLNVPLTRDQCVPNILAGNRGFCNQNPWFEGWWKPQEPARRPAKRRHHRG